MGFQFPRRFPVPHFIFEVDLKESDTKKYDYREKRLLLVVNFRPKFERRSESGRQDVMVAEEEKSKKKKIRGHQRNNRVMICRDIRRGLFSFLLSIEGQDAE